MADLPEIQPTLHEVIVAFQKELARARRDAHEVSFAPSVRDGIQPLFVVEALDIDLRAALAVPNDNRRDEVRVDFSAPADRCSSIRFRVAMKPVDSRNQG